MTMHTRFFLAFSLSFLGSASGGFGAATAEGPGYAGSLYMAGDILSQSSAFFDAGLGGERSLAAGVALRSSEFDEATGRAFDGDADVANLGLGFFQDFNGFSVGFVLNMSDTDFDSDSSTENEEIKTQGDGVSATFGLGKSFDRLSLSINGSFGELSLDSDRRTPLGTKNASYDVTLMQLELMAAYDWIETEDLFVAPYLKLGYRSLESNTFSEAGSGADAREFGEIEDDVPFAELGATARFLGLGAFVPKATVAVWQDLGDDEIDFTFEPGAGAFSIPDAKQTVIEASLGFDWTLSQAFTLESVLGYFQGDDVDGFSLGLAGHWLF